MLLRTSFACRIVQFIWYGGCSCHHDVFDTLLNTLILHPK